ALLEVAHRPGYSLHRGGRVKSRDHDAGFTPPDQRQARQDGRGKGLRLAKADDRALGTDCLLWDAVGRLDRRLVGDLHEQGDRRNGIVQRAGLRRLWRRYDDRAVYWRLFYHANR